MHGLLDSPNSQRESSALTLPIPWPALCDTTKMTLLKTHLALLTRRVSQLRNVPRSCQLHRRGPRMHIPSLRRADHSGGYEKQLGRQVAETGRIYTRCLCSEGYWNGKHLHGPFGLVGGYGCCGLVSFGLSKGLLRL